MLGPTIAPPVAAWIVGFGYPGEPGFTPLAVVIYDWLGGLFAPSSPGITPDSALSLFYNSKNNEFMSLTVGLKDEASALNGTGFFFGRVAEYSTMNFLNNTIYPTYPEYQILNYSGSGLNASLASELQTTASSWLTDYTGAVQDSVRYAQLSFTGSLSGLDLKVDSFSVKTMVNDFEVLYGPEHIGAIAQSNATVGTFKIGILIANDSHLFYLLFGTYGCTCNATLTNLLDNTTIHLYCSNSTACSETTIPLGIWNVTATITDNSPYATTIYSFLSNGFWLSVTAPYPTETETMICSNTTGAAYSTLNFINTYPTTYTINLSNTTQCDPSALMISLQSALNFAISLSNSYWTTLRNAGIYNASLIPANMVIPLPDFAFLTNTDLSQLTSEEITAMYLAYLHALGNFFNSTTYQNIVNFNTANVTFANEAVIINASASRNSTIYTDGFLYVQVYADMTLKQGLNTLNSSGLIYNLNDTTCWSYASGDVLNISNIYVKVNGTYQEVNETTITATNIEAYIYNSSSGSGLVPTPTAIGGAGGSSALLIVAIVVILALMLRGRAGSSTTNNYKVTRATKATNKSKFPLFFNPLENKRS